MIDRAVLSDFFAKLLVTPEGRLNLTDRFVRPNYSAALGELIGRLGAFRSGSTELATLALTGRAATRSSAWAA